MKVYLDNAATTAIRTEVLDEMLVVMAQQYGNPSSPHSFGRSSKSVIELSRKKIAKLLGANASEIIFTSGATEANNWILNHAVTHLKVQRIITTKIEHHAVLDVVEHLEKSKRVEVVYLNLNEHGAVDINQLVATLSDHKPTLVSLMHINNEIGTITDIELIGKICKEHQALFHSDTVQSVGKLPINLAELQVDFIVASAHKFYGPKGIGFAYIKKNSGLKPLFLGGEQEKGLRAGTEATHQIAGMAKAIEIAYERHTAETQLIKNLRQYLISKIESNLPATIINGEANGLPHVVNLRLSKNTIDSELILFQLDMKGIAISKGSACQSGSSKPSHVLAQILPTSELQKPSIRVSFSHCNTAAELDYLVDCLTEIVNK
jgi:cysteine desulfurase